MSAPKDPTELGLIKKACQITCTVFSKHVKKEIVTIVDVEKKVKHSKLAEEIEQAIVDGKYSPPGSADEVVSYNVIFFAVCLHVHVHVLMVRHLYRCKWLWD